MARDREPLADVEVREEALSNVRDALASLQRVPAAGLDESKHETIRELTDGAASLERSLSNEVDQMRDDDA